MHFLNPAFLWAMTAIAVPILIHLFNLRKYKKIQFSSVRFLKKINKTQKQKRTVKQWLILAVRILFIIALSLAFAQPYFGIQNKNTERQQKTVCIYIDNSFSMNAEGTYGKLLNQALSLVPEILKAYPPDTKYILLSNDRKGEHQHIITQSQLSNYAAKIQQTSVSVKLSQIMQTFSNILQINNITRSDIFLISDFQSSTADFDNITTDTLFNYYLIQLKPKNYKNLSIDTCWFSTPVRIAGKDETLFVTVTNHSEKNYNSIPLNLKIDEQPVAFTSFDIAAGEKKNVKLNFFNNKIHINKCKIEITDYPIVFDNVLYFSYTIKTKYKVLIVTKNARNSKIGILYADTTMFNTDITPKPDLTKTGNYDLIIFDEPTQIQSGVATQLYNYVKSGGNLTIIPAAPPKQHDYEALYQTFGISPLHEYDSSTTEITQINTNSLLYKNSIKEIPKLTQLPQLHGIYKTTKSPRQEILLSTSLYPALIQTQHNNGNLYIFTFPLSKSDFLTNPLTIPTFYNMAWVSNTKNNLYSIIGNKTVIRPHTNIKTNSIISLTSPNSPKIIPAIIPGHTSPYLRIDINDIKAGNYDLVISDTTVDAISLNYNRLESVLKYYDTDSLTKYNDYYKKFEADPDKLVFDIQQTAQTQTLWRLFVFLALFFVVAEILIIRFL